MENGLTDQVTCPCPGPLFLLQSAARAAASATEATGNTMPALTHPTDKLSRGGLRSMRHEMAAKHPIEAMQEAWHTQKWGNDLHHAERVFGPGTAMRMRMDRAILSQFQRAPGLASDFVGLDTILSRDITVGFEDILDVPETRTDTPLESVHDALDRKLGMA